MSPIVCALCHRQNWTGFRVNRIRSGRRIVARSDAGRFCLRCAQKTAQGINDELKRLKAKAAPPRAGRGGTRLKDVIASYRKMVTGETSQRGLSDPHRRPSDTAFRVVREATEADYRACLRAYGVPDDDPPFFEPVHFYEVQFD